jgi:3-oxoacyl-[acyl-carrier protein] reductase
MLWSGQVALVTGAARGIGRATARRLAAHGAAVCVNYLTRDAEAEAVAAEIRAGGGRAIAVHADIGEAAEVARMIARAEAELGPLTILVNNAGLSLQATLETYDAAALARMRRVNVDGPINTIRAVVPGMRSRRYGRIVTVSSIAAQGTQLPGNAFYAATKAEVDILTRRFAMEVGADGITVNAVAPGFIRTEMNRRDRGEAEYAAVLQRLGARAMMGRAGEPEDIANAVAFLAAPDSGFITAQVLTVDGGRMDYIG